MNERKLKIFFEVAKSLNMTETSKNLYISQPAVSMAVSEIENELGVKLFERIGKKLYLTYEGEVFLEYARRILNIYDECRIKIGHITDLKCGKLKIGASTTIGIYLLPEMIGSFGNTYKDIEISIVIENTKIIENMLLENKIDIAFVEGPVYSDEIAVKDFCDDELAVIVSSKHRLADFKEVDKKELENEKFILREIGSGTREVFEQAFYKSGLEYKVAFELGNTEAIKKAVIANLGISCVSERCVRDEVDLNRISILKVKDVDLSRKFHFIYHKDKYFSNILNLFVEHAYDFIIYK